MESIQKNTIILLIIGLLIGTGGGYFVSSSTFQSRIRGYETNISSLSDDVSTLTQQVSELEDDLSLKDVEISALESQIAENEGEILRLQSLLQDIESVNNDLQDQNNELFNNITDLQNENKELENNYSELVKTINAIEVMNWTRTIPYNISAGTSKIWSFAVPKGGLIWEANIWFSSGYISLGHSWKRGDLSGNVGGSGLSLEYLGYPHQDSCAGTITCKWFDDGSGRITVTGIITTQFKEIIRDDWYSYRID